MYSRPPSTSWASQILSNNVFGMVMVSLVECGSSCVSTASQPGADDGQDGRLRDGVVLKMVRQVSVEGHAITLLQLMALPVADKHNGPSLDERRLATAGLMH